MSVLRKYNPTTEQWEILQGGVQGLQGPPVALSKGTVTTTPPGTNADFTVTGTPTNQKLNLTIPRGDVGPAGGPIPEGGAPGQFPTPDGAGGYAWSDIATTTYLIVGPGRPDTPATTGGVITGSEPVGAEYRSTDGAGVGAWVWMKRGTKWVVTSGDTGWRDLQATAQGNVSTFTLLARVTDAAIHIKWVATLTARDWQLGFLRSGFSWLPEWPSGTLCRSALDTTHGLFTGGSSWARRASELSLWKVIAPAYLDPGTWEGTGTFDPPDTWFTTLPGTPA